MMNAELETKLANLYIQLKALKAEFKTAETPGVRQLIHEDIAATLDAIERLEDKLNKSR